MNDQLQFPARVFWLGCMAGLAWVLTSGCQSPQSGGVARLPRAAEYQVLGTNAVPFSLADGHILVPGILNGHGMRYLLDTGATAVALTPQAAAQAGLEGDREIMIRGFGGEGMVKLAVAKTVSVGSAIGKEVPAMILPLPEMFEADGFLGLSFLQGFLFSVDYDRQVIEFHDFQALQPAPAGNLIPLQIANKVMTAEAEVDGVSGRFLVDTGAGQELILNHWFVEKSQLRATYPNRLPSAGGGLFGQSTGETIRIRSFKLGPFTLTNCVAELLEIDGMPDGIAGVIGGNLLSRFNLTFDIPGRRLWMEPNETFNKPRLSSAILRSGMVCMPSGTSYIVLNVVPGSPAAEAGVRVGDTVLSIEGKSVSEMRFTEIKRAFQAEPGTPVRLRIQSENSAPRDAVLILRQLL